MTSDVTIPRAALGLFLISFSGSVARHAPELPADGSVDWIAILAAITILIVSAGLLLWGVVQFVGGLWALARGR